MQTDAENVYSTSPERRRAALTRLALPACYRQRFPATYALLLDAEFVK